MKKLTPITLLCTLISTLSIGCSTHSPLSLPPGTPTMQELFEGGHAERPSLPSGFIRLDGTDKSINMAPSTPMLPNPHLQMYVFPHLSPRDRVLIPGYWITFGLYERNEPALDSEVVTTQHPEHESE